MGNYFASEVGLTKATKQLLANKPAEIVYPSPDADPLYRVPHVKRQAPVHAKPEVAKPKRAKITKLMREDLESFQHHRIFSVIRGMDGKSDCNGGRG